jgi:transcriptional regulator with XRE-family HTH domain
MFYGPMRTTNGRGRSVRRQRGEVVRDWRERAGLTQEQLADAVGVKPQSVSAYETGKYDPKPSAVRAMDDVLGANGELLSLYGLSPILPSVELADMVRQLVETIADLEARLQRHLDEDHRDGRPGRRRKPRDDG